MKMAKVESAMRLALAYYEAFDRQDAAGMAALLSEGCRFERGAPAPDGETILGKEAITQYWTRYFAETGGSGIEIEDLFGMGRRCVALWRRASLKETGEETAVRGVDIVRVDDGLIVEILSYVKA